MCNPAQPHPDSATKQFLFYSQNPKIYTLVRWLFKTAAAGLVGRSCPLDTAVIVAYLGRVGVRPGPGKVRAVPTLSCPTPASFALSPLAAAGVVWL